MHMLHDWRIIPLEKKKATKTPIDFSAVFANTQSHLCTTDIKISYNDNQSNALRRKHIA